MVKAWIGAAMALLCLGVGYSLGQRAEAARLAVLEERTTLLEERATLIRLRIEHLKALGEELKAEASFHDATVSR